MIDTTGKTIQQVSDEIAGKLIKQGKRCIQGDNGRCVYGDGLGNHCGIGWLLDASNDSIMGNWRGVQCLSNSSIDLGINDAFIREHYGVLGWIQDLHDSPQYRHGGKVTSLNLDAWQPWFDLHS
jgi:hypothetical protein